MQVKDFMIRKVYTVNPENSIKELLIILQKNWQ